VIISSSGEAQNARAEVPVARTSEQIPPASTHRVSLLRPNGQHEPRCEPSSASGEHYDRPIVRVGVELLDRGEETGVVSRLVANAIGGIGGVVMLEGPAGIGKTALIRSAGELAEDHQLRILRATGSELD
jgi:hypothetical protein